MRQGSAGRHGAFLAAAQPGENGAQPGPGCRHRQRAATRRSRTTHARCSDHTRAIDFRTTRARLWRRAVPSSTGTRRRTRFNFRSRELSRDREDFCYREDFSCVWHEFLTSREKSSRSWRYVGLPASLVFRQPQKTLPPRSLVPLCIPLGHFPTNESWRVRRYARLMHSCRTSLGLMKRFILPGR
jgi:hypothetical protein